MFFLGNGAHGTLWHDTEISVAIPHVKTVRERFSVIQLCFETACVLDWFMFWRRIGDTIYEYVYEYIHVVYTCWFAFDRIIYVYVYIRRVCISGLWNTMSYVIPPGCGLCLGIPPHYDYTYNRIPLGYV